MHTGIMLWTLWSVFFSLFFSFLFLYLFFFLSFHFMFWKYMFWYINFSLWCIWRCLFFVCFVLLSSLYYRFNLYHRNSTCQSSVCTSGSCGCVEDSDCSENLFCSSGKRKFSSFFYI